MNAHMRWYMGWQLSKVGEITAVEFGNALNAFAFKYSKPAGSVTCHPDLKDSIVRILADNSDLKVRIFEDAVTPKNAIFIGEHVA
jgi:hypothetical protein